MGNMVHYSLIIVTNKCQVFYCGPLRKIQKGLDKMRLAKGSRHSCTK